MRGAPAIVAHAMGLWRVLAVLGSLAICFGVGVLGFGHGGPETTGLDTRFFFLAGRYWLAGINAYAPAQAIDAGPLGDVYTRYVMGYPPQSALLCMALALVSARSAELAMSGLNLAAVGVLAWIAVASVEEAVPPATSTAQRWYVPALVAGNLATAYVLWMGQTTLIVAAALAACWWCARYGRPVLAGVLLALASIKPPLSVFVALWLVLERQGRVLAAAATATCLLALVPMVVLGPLAAWREWLVAVAHYAGAPQNAVGSRMVFNLRSLLYACGLHSPDFLGLGVVATLALFAARERFAAREILGLLIGFGLVFGYGHGYDLAALVVLVPAFWVHLRERPYAAGGALVLLAGITFPNRLLLPLGSEPLLHLRVVLVMLALGWLAALGVAATTRAKASAAQPAAFAPWARWFPSTSRMP